MSKIDSRYVEEKNKFLPDDSDVVSFAYNKVFNNEYKTRKVFKDENDDHYYSGFLDCIRWLKENHYNKK